MKADIVHLISLYATSLFSWNAESLRKGLNFSLLIL